MAAQTPALVQPHASGRADYFKETALLPDFLTDKNVGAPQVDETQTRKRRKQEGALYTPAFITR